MTSKWGYFVLYLLCSIGGMYLYDHSDFKGAGIFFMILSTYYINCWINSEKVYVLVKNKEE